MSEQELKELAADILKNGLREQVLFFRNDEQPKALLDGRNKLDAMAYAGLLTADKNGVLWTKKFERGVWQSREALAGKDRYGDPYALTLSYNLHRRHLTPKQKRDLIAKLLKANPDKSDRQIAEQTKTSPTTVGKVRAKKEASGDVSKVDTRTDTKGGKQPTKKIETKTHCIRD